MGLLGQVASRSRTAAPRAPTQPIARTNAVATKGELDGVDNYKYRYYVTGKVGDLNALPSNPKPDSEASLFSVHDQVPPRKRHGQLVQ